MVKFISFVFILVLPLKSLAQSPRQMKTSFGSGSNLKNGIVISSIIGQPSPVNAIGTGKLKLFQGFHGPTGASQKRLEALDALAIFPNPNDGTFTIYVDDHQLSGAYLVSLFDNVGRLIASNTVNATAKHLECDFSSVAKGIYHVHLYNSESRVGGAKVFIK